MEEDIKECEELIKILDKTSETGKSKHTDCIKNLIAINKELVQTINLYKNASDNVCSTFKTFIQELYIPKSKVQAKIHQFESIRDEILRLEKELKRPSITYDLKRNDYCVKLLKELL